MYVGAGCPAWTSQVSQVSLLGPGFPQVLRGLEKPAYRATRGSRWTREDDPARNPNPTWRIHSWARGPRRAQLHFYCCVNDSREPRWKTRGGVVNNPQSRARDSGNSCTGALWPHQLEEEVAVPLAWRSHRSERSRDSPGLHPLRDSWQVSSRPPSEDPEFQGLEVWGGAAGAPASSEFLHFKAGRRRGRGGVGVTQSKDSICFVRVGDQ